MSRGNFILSAILWSIIAFLVIFPLSILVLESFKIAKTGGMGIGNYLEFFKDTYYLKTFGNTLLLSTLVLLTTTVFGVPLAYILARYRQRGKTIFTALILLPIVLPAFAGVFAFIIFFGKWGTLNLLLMDLGLIEQPVKDDQIDLKALMAQLGSLGITSLLIEGGSRVIASAIRSGIIDKALFFYAPKILGGDDGIPICRGPGPERMKDCIQLRDIRVQRFDDDVMIEGYIEKR